MHKTFTQSKKYTIVQFIDDVHEGYEYVNDSWPLHSTIIDTFAINWSPEEMITKMTEALRHYDNASSISEDDRLFGRSGQVLVTVLNRSKALFKIHTDLLALLEKGGIMLEKPQYAYDGFIPHATVQRHARLNKGDNVQFTALSIVDMSPSDIINKRKVLKTIKIGT
jgi:hypothetical protein